MLYWISVFNFYIFKIGIASDSIAVRCSDLGKVRCVLGGILECHLAGMLCVEFPP